MGAAMSSARPTPVKMVTRGVTSRSTMVSLLTALPSSAATMAMSSTASGPPAPPSSLEAQPTVTRLNSTKLGACRA